jgi:hypothetical protein
VSLGGENLIIEINKDIDRYQESVVMGLSAKQMVFSIASVVVGGGLVLLLYRYIGLTGAAYVAIPCVAPIALGGFYSYNGMDFYEYMRRKFYFMFGNKALTYVSTEGDAAIKAFEMEYAFVEKAKRIKFKCKKVDKTKEDVKADNKGSKEDFEEMKKKAKKIAIACIGVIVAAIAGITAYKYMY